LNMNEKLIVMAWL